MKLFTLPNILTLLRILFIPVVIVGLFINTEASRWWAFSFYAIAGVTDFFDGYLARVLQETSKIGTFLDPIADKLLIAAVLMMLVNNGILIGFHVIPALIILIREITISGLREFLAESNLQMPVTKAAKWKTLCQIFSLGFLIVGASSPHWIPSFIIGKTLVWIAAFLTLHTGYAYIKNTWIFLRS